MRSLTNVFIRLQKRCSCILFSSSHYLSVIFYFPAREEGEHFFFLFSFTVGMCVHITPPPEKRRQHFVNESSIFNRFNHQAVMMRPRKLLKNMHQILIAYMPEFKWYCMLPLAHEILIRGLIIISSTILPTGQQLKEAKNEM